MPSTVIAWAVAISLVLRIASCQRNCSNYVLLSARGTTEPQGPSVGFVGMINTTLTTLPNGIEYDVVYPASANLTANLGADDITRYINSSIIACPNTQFALLGYSQGAAATALGLDNFVDANSSAYKAIKAVIVIGNPGHVPNASANVDQFGGSSTRSYTGSFYLNGALAVPTIYYTDNKILDICYQGDPICAAGYPNASFIPDHLLYGSDPNVQELGADFLISKLGGAANGSTTTTTTSITTTTSLAYTSPATTTTSSMVSSRTASVGVPSASVTLTPSTGMASGLAVNLVITVVVVLASILHLSVA